MEHIGIHACGHRLRLYILKKSKKQKRKYMQ